jgi:hypothetical protein
VSALEGTNGQVIWWYWAYGDIGCLFYDTLGEAVSAWCLAGEEGLATLHCFEIDDIVFDAMHPVVQQYVKAYENAKTPTRTRPPVAKVVIKAPRVDRWAVEDVYMSIEGAEEARDELVEILGAERVRILNEGERI